MTEWGRAVTPDNVHAEYPRPQLTRDAWLNLNGQWDYAIRPADESRPPSFDGRIVVPFPVESVLSGVAQRVAPDETLWYHRRFRVRADWRDGRVLLHFGAIDWSATVEVNGHEVGQHRGGYDPFSFDITDALRDGDDQELVVRVSDPTDAGTQPRGKQVAAAKGIWYTPTTGIWQTVWLEPVPSTHISALRFTSTDRTTVRIDADVVNAPGGATWWVEVLDGATQVASARGAVGAPLVLTIPNAKSWSPETPFLYDLRAGLTLGDTVGSYFGLRDIRLGKDKDDHVRLLLKFSSVAIINDSMSLGQKLNAIAIPVMVLTLVVLAHMMRMTRAAILNVMQSAYIETAELKGMGMLKIIRKHAFPNAIAPIVNVVMLNLAYLVVGVVVVEVVFAYPGMGQYLVDHVSKRDVPVVQACGLIFAAVYIGLNLVADIVSILANPRLRHPK